MTLLSPAGIRRRRRRACLLAILTAGAAVAVPATVAASPAHGVSHAVARALALEGRVAHRTAPFTAHGTRMRAGRTMDIQYSTNWSGLAGTGTAIEGAQATWTVPSVTSSSAARYSASWVGVDGYSNDDLIQTGTGQDTSDGYYAWYEILPADETEIVDASGAPATVKPGDHMEGYVEEVSSGTWTIFLEDVTQDWTFDEEMSYDGPGTSAEWIEEAPTVNNEQSTPADFGTVKFADTEVYKDLGESEAGWYATDLDSSNEIAMVNEDDTKILAMPSAPTTATSAGQTFTDTYVTAPGKPTDVKGTAEAEAAKVTWTKPSATGGTAVDGYDVRVYRAGVLRRTLTVTGTSVTVRNMIAGASYRFTVAAHTAGNYTGAYSTESAVVKPKS